MGDIPKLNKVLPRSSFLYKEKYSIIYANPPWYYHNKNIRGSATKHYCTLHDHDIQKLDVGSIAADNSALLLWTTFPKLPIGMEVLASWGFEYKTVAFVWVKLNQFSDTPFFGTGFYTRSNSEACLLGIRGKMARQSKSVHSIIQSKCLIYSKKPKEARQRIIELFGDLPRVELFATQNIKGWDCTGINCDGLDIREFIKNKLQNITR